MAEANLPSPATAGGSDAPALVVGLGASAGGIEALSTFFANAPPDTPFAYVVVLHLSPDHESKLAEVLQHSASIPVSQVRDTVRLAAGHVYVVPPNASLHVTDGQVSLLSISNAEERRAPIDFFFRTLADSYSSHAVVVVLSGTGPNGSTGLKRVKERGGLAIAQDPDDAAYRDMPTNAIATGFVDYVLPASAMPWTILQYYERLRRLPSYAFHTAIDPDSGDVQRDLLALLRARTGHDFSHYRSATLNRRIDRRMNVCGVVSRADYVQYLREHPEESIALMKELLISVTNFFRDPEAFAVLERRVIPRLFERKTAADQVRVWSAGCATGEEAYSLAMLLVEHASLLPDPPSIQVFATDLDEQAIAAAREALYHETDIADVSQERLKRFFQRDPAGYRIRRELRELVLFARHDVIKDPPFSHLDLISCRNLLIYLNRMVQDRLLETFHFALRPGGLLFLGSAESAEGDLFVPYDKPAHIYESRPAISRSVAVLTERHTAPATWPALVSEVRPARRISPGDLHVRLLEQYAPPSIVVSAADSSIVHVSETATPYLLVAPGEPSADLWRTLHPDLRVDVRTALGLAAQKREVVEVEGVQVNLPGGPATIKVTVKPALGDGGSARGYYLVLFEADRDGPPPAAATRLSSPTSMQVPEFEEELSRIKEQLRVTIEQYETQAEEFKAANEELQAMNEELRSAAEELETSREELQSVNEELTTVNQELKIKIEELGLTNNDFLNLINSTDIGTIFLDRNLRVKLATPRASDVFNLLPADIGRPLSDITSRLVDDRLHDDVKQVLETLNRVERDVQCRDGRWYALRIIPYRTADDRIDGVSITFLEVTRRYHAEQRVRASEERLRALIDSAVDYAIFTLTPEGVVDYWNVGAQRMFGYAADEIIGQNAEVLFTPEDRAAGVPQRELDRAAERGRAEDERWHVRKDGTRFFASGVTTRLTEGAIPGFAKIARDLTGKQEAAMALERARSELEDRVRRRTAQLEAEVIRRTEAQEQVTKLLGRLVTAQEDQRARIARDLHDHLGQQLTALRLTLERLRDTGAATGVDAEGVDRTLAITKEIDAALDFLAWELRPAVLDHLGLPAALPRFVEEWSRHYGIPSRSHVVGDFTGQLSREAETTFYRVAQEALSNVAKHAHAGSVDVLLERHDGTVVMVVEDDGIGFDATDPSTRERGFGLVGMRERAALIDADLHIESAPDKGTSIFLRYHLVVAEAKEPR